MNPRTVYAALKEYEDYIVNPPIIYKPEETTTMTARDAYGRFAPINYANAAAAINNAFGAQPVPAPVPVPKALPKFGAKITPPYQVRSLYTAYPNCCAINVINSFSNVGDVDLDKEIKGQLSKTDKGYYSKGGLITIALNHDQVNKKVDKETTWHDVMLNNGFKLVAECTNPVHADNSMVFLYILGTGKQTNIASLEKKTLA